MDKKKRRERALFGSKELVREIRESLVIRKRMTAINPTKPMMKKI